jgi:hypothetical protein
MDNNNPAEMSNMDLEKDMQQRNREDDFVNDEDVSKSTAAEGTLKNADADESSKVGMSTEYKKDEEQDLDDLVHVRAKEGHNGSLPDPEEAKLRGD